MPKLPYLYLLILLLVLTTSLAGAQPTPTALALACNACHGTHGKSAEIIPRLDTLTPEQILQAMTSFKRDQRHATLMNRIAKGYSDEQLQAIADYFGKKP